MSNQTTRIDNLDYLRGLAALGIMLFHYKIWAYGDGSSELFIERVGIYGVSIFYILSGLTLYSVYNGKFVADTAHVLSFLKKRIARIYPLLWLTIALTVWLAGEGIDWPKLLLNLSGLFGFFTWDQYITVGSWSIGNELVFYTLFPLLLYAARKNAPVVIAVTIAALLLFSWFSFYVFSTNDTLAEQWHDYTNPLNQVFFFWSGMLIGRTLKQVQVSNAMSIAAIIAGLLLFIFYPASGDQIAIVTGATRIAFTLSILLITAGCYKMTATLPRPVHFCLGKLGEISYSLYLLHPIVLIIVKRTMLHLPFQVNLELRLIISGIITIVASYISYTYFEKYFIAKAKKKEEMFPKESIGVPQN
jgi:exopolysaccharide production protein ExoZ